mmetsp:Transcript_24246/g.42943  ORF Transcript_24246/g.42943 Transcript_24246/m.42943 type:complete len:289 (+) Transcript_24246:1668-2534(+)
MAFFVNAFALPLYAAVRTHLRLGAVLASEAGEAEALRVAAHAVAVAVAVVAVFADLTQVAVMAWRAVAFALVALPAVVAVVGARVVDREVRAVFALEACEAEARPRVETDSVAGAVSGTRGLVQARRPSPQRVALALAQNTTPVAVAVSGAVAAVLARLSVVAWLTVALAVSHVAHAVAGAREVRNGRRALVRETTAVSVVEQVAVARAFEALAVHAAVGARYVAADAAEISVALAQSLDALAVAGAVVWAADGAAVESGPAVVALACAVVLAAPVGSSAVGGAGDVR